MPDRGMKKFRIGILGVAGAAGAIEVAIGVPLFGPRPGLIMGLFTALLVIAFFRFAPGLDRRRHARDQRPGEVANLPCTLFEGRAILRGQLFVGSDGLRWKQRRGEREVVRQWSGITRIGAFHERLILPATWLVVSNAHGDLHLLVTAPPTAIEPIARGAGVVWSVDERAKLAASPES
jgi:hypothetical protein